MIEAFVVPRVLGHTTLPAGVRCAWERLLGSGGRVAIGDLVDDIGPGAGDRGGRVVVAGPPAEVARSADSRTAPFLARALGPLEGRWTSDTVDRAPS